MVDARHRPELAGRLRALASRAAEARRTERAALDERAAAIVAAVRAGAQLAEVGEAAGMTKAAASAIARRTLAARPPSGGPYRRRRGVVAALEAVDETARLARAASGAAHEALLERDQAIAAAAEEGLGVPAISEALGMPAPLLYQLLRRRRMRAKKTTSGTLAS